MPLTPRQKALNRCHSRVRCRVEHVFGAIGNGTNTRCMNCIGIRRSRVWIGLVNLCCNMKRFEYLERAEAVSWGESCHNGPNEGRGLCQDAELGWFGLQFDWIWSDFVKYPWNLSMKKLKNRLLKIMESRILE